MPSADPRPPITSLAELDEDIAALARHLLSYLDRLIQLEEEGGELSVTMLLIATAEERLGELRALRIDHPHVGRRLLGKGPVAEEQP